MKLWLVALSPTEQVHFNAWWITIRDHNLLLLSGESSMKIISPNWFKPPKSLRSQSREWFVLSHSLALLQSQVLICRRISLFSDRFWSLLIFYINANRFLSAPSTCNQLLFQFRTSNLFFESPDFKMFKALTVLLFLSAAVNAQISKLSDAVVKDLDGNEISFKKFEGKCVLAINTASKCGFTGECPSGFNLKLSTCSNWNWKFAFIANFWFKIKIRLSN